MNDERFYCGSHREPVEFQPELNAYTCNRCEHTLTRNEVVTARDLIRTINPKPNLKTRRSEVEFE